MSLPKQGKKQPKLSYFILGYFLLCGYYWLFFVIEGDALPSPLLDPSWVQVNQIREMFGLEARF
jgi:hypothetical protein